MKYSLCRLLVAICVSTVLGACVTTPAIVQPQKRFFWPPEPDQPRIEWIAAYFGDMDIKTKTFMSEIVGEETSVVLKRPVAIAGDGEGRFVVSDQENMQAFLFDLNKQTVSVVGGENAEMGKPSGVSVDKDGNFYVADTRSQKVFVVNGQNSVVRVLALSGYVKGIGGICVDRIRGRLLVTDPREGKVLIFSLTGEYVSTVNGKGYYTYPNSVAVESNGTIVIADTFNAAIVRFSTDGTKYLSFFGKRGDSAGSFSLVTGVAVDSEDHIYVTDGKLHNISLFNTNGDTLMVLGGQHSVNSGNIGRGGFLIPQGISIDKNDRIYVADSMNRRVQILQYLNQRYLAVHPIEPPKP